MTLLTDGCGAFAYRVTIDGCPSSPVTLVDMVAAAGNTTPARVDGLMMQDQKFTAKADPLACKLTVGGLTIKVADIDGAWSAVFDKAPTNVTWLTANVSESAATIPVSSTTGFASSGRIWIDSECIYYSSKDSTNFLGCTRGVLSDDADAETWHYTTDGERRRSPEVTDWPVLWEGRRVRVYRYQESDSLSGSGTQVYLGVVSTSPQFNGVSWSLGVDSIVGIFNQTLGADLSEACYPAGITYSPTYPYVLTIQQSADAVPYTAPQIVCFVVMHGHWETQEAFCESVNDEIDAACTAAGFTNTIRAVSDGPSGYHFEAYTLSGDDGRAIIIVVRSPIDPDLWGWNGGPQSQDGTFVSAIEASRTYYYYSSTAAASTTGVPPALAAPSGVPGAGTVPRGTFDHSDGEGFSRSIWLGGSATISPITTAVMIEWPGDSDNPLQSAIESYSAGTRRITVPQGYVLGDAGTVGPGSGLHAYTSASLPKIRFGLSLSPSTAGVASDDFLATITSLQQQCSTLGVVPMLREGDYDAAGWTAAAATGQPSLVTLRKFTTFAPVSIMDIITEELKLAGCFLAVDSTGRLVPKRLRLPAASELGGTDAIDQTTLLTDEILLSHEVGGLGQVNQVLMRTGYDPKEDEYTGRTWITRDVAAFGQSPSVRQVTIEPKSEYVGPDITEDDVVQCASGYFGTFAGSYAVDTMDVAMHDDVELGDPVVFSNPHYPDETGAIGVTGKVGLVISRETAAYSPRARITCLTTKQKLGGYAPAFDVISNSDEGGGSFQMTVDTSLCPSGTDCLDWVTVGDMLRVIQFNDSTSALVFIGTVTDVDTDEIFIQFDPFDPWVPGISSWYVTMADSNVTGLADTQKVFCSIATSTGHVEYDGETVPAFRFGA